MSDLMLLEAPAPTLEYTELCSSEEALMLQRPRGIEIDVTEYIDRTLLAHKSEIARWGGWRWHSPLYPGDFANTEGVAALVQNHVTKFANKHPELYGYWSNYRKSTRFVALLPESSSAVFRHHKWPKSLEGANANFVTEHIVSPRVGQVTARAIMAKLRKIYAPHASNPLCKTYMKMWETLFAILGEYCQPKTGLQITLSCAPSDFAWLGTIEKEHGGSCYANGMEYSKYNLAVTPHSCVAFAYFHNQGVTQGPQRLIRHSIPDARAWGFVFDDFAIFSNYYRTKRELLAPYLQQALNAAFDLNITSVNHGSSSIPIADHAYANRDATLFAHKHDMPLDRGLYTIGDHVSMFRDNNETYDRTSCSSCNVFIPIADRIICNLCEDSICNDCAVECSCGKYCPSHGVDVSFCSVCDYSSCNRCDGDNYDLITCAFPGCTIEACNGCMGSRCATCDVSYCERHSSFYAPDREVPSLIECGACERVTCLTCRCPHTDNLVRDIAWEGALGENARYERLIAQGSVQEVREYMMRWAQLHLSANNPIMDRLHATIVNCDCNFCRIAILELYERLSREYPFTLPPHLAQYVTSTI